MAESKKCQICGKPATVHLTQIVGNKINKIDLCAECAKAKGITDPEGFSLGDIPSSPSHQENVAPESLVCDTCGFTPNDFKKLGHFGCPDCYESFAPVIMPMLRNVHRETEHKGKVPERSLERVSLRKQVAVLDAELGHAVRDERFEDAAKLRDQISALNETLQKTAK